MGFFGFFRGTPKKRTLADIPTDELNRERLTCEQELAKKERDLAKLSKDQEQLEHEYASAKSEYDKKRVARLYQQCQKQQSMVDGWVTRLNKNLQIVNGFLMLKQNQEFYKKAGVLSVLSQLDVTEIEKFISEAAVDGALDNDKMASILQALESGNEMSSETDDGLADAMSQLERKTAGIKMDDGLNDVETTLKKKVDDGIRDVNQMLGEK